MIYDIIYLIQPWYYFSKSNLSLSSVDKKSSQDKVRSKSDDVGNFPKTGDSWKYEV